LDKYWQVGLMRQFAGASEREKRLQAKAHEPHPEERRLRRVSKDEATGRAAWLSRRCGHRPETASRRLLTMRSYPGRCAGFAPVWVQNSLSPCDKSTRRANHFGFSEMLSSPRIENIPLCPRPKSDVQSCRLPRQEGRSRSSRPCGGMRWTLMLRLTSVA
jgi:hypothetical protein